MKSYTCLLWDLDGTLTRSHEGIFNCMRYALEKLGKPQPTDDQLRLCVGPPLDWSFENLFGLSPEEAQVGIRLYRERYDVLGWRENNPVEGAKEALKQKNAFLEQFMAQNEYVQTFANDAFVVYRCQ